MAVTLQTDPVNTEGSRPLHPAIQEVGDIDQRPGRKWGNQGRLPPIRKYFAVGR
jgi:hypothetical protein